MYNYTLFLCVLVSVKRYAPFKIDMTVSFMTTMKSKE